MPFEMKILLTAAVALGGFLWSYAFLRQILFNFLVAYPLIKKMRSLREDLIAIGATRYTNVSNIVCLLLAGVLAFVVIFFFPVYLSISFGVGALVSLAMLIKMVSPRNRVMFDSFCMAYYRFVPDDELRTAIYNKKTGPIRNRLRNMNIHDTFIPEFHS